MISLMPRRSLDSLMRLFVALEAKLAAFIKRADAQATEMQTRIDSLSAEKTAVVADRDRAERIRQKMTDLMA